MLRLKLFFQSIIFLFTLIIVSSSSEKLPPEVEILEEVKNLQPTPNLSTDLQTSKQKNNLTQNQVGLSRINVQRVLIETDQSTEKNTNFSDSETIRENTQDNSEEELETVTEIFIIDLPEFSSEEDLVVIVENNHHLSDIPELIGDHQPIVVFEEDFLISSWWTIENEENGFETWDDLEDFIESEYGDNIHTGIDPNPEDVPIDLEISFLEDGEVESIVELEAPRRRHYNLGTVEPLFALSVSASGCAQAVQCEKISIGRIGHREVCKKQLVCGALTLELEEEEEQHDSVHHDAEHHDLGDSHHV